MININLFIYETCACLTFFYYNQCIFKHRWNTHKRWAYMRRTNTEKRSYEINASNTNKKKLGMRQKKNLMRVSEQREWKEKTHRWRIEAFFHLKTRIDIQQMYKCISRAINLIFRIFDVVEVWVVYFKRQMSI